MKKYSKDELQKLAAPHFERFGLSKLYATSDGQIFIMENRAKLHANNKMAVYELHSDSKPVEVKYKDHIVTADDLQNNPDLERQGVKVGEIIQIPVTTDDDTDDVLLEILSRVTNVKALEMWLQNEVAGKNRTVMIEAIKARIQAVLDANTEGLPANNADVNTTATKPISVKDLVAQIAAIDSVDELNKMLEAEKAGANRATAVKAIEERIQKLSK